MTTSDEFMEMTKGSRQETSNDEVARIRSEAYERGHSEGLAVGRKFNCSCPDYEEATRAFLRSLPLSLIDDEFGHSGASAEEIAGVFHDVYEALARTYGYETRPESRVVWAAVPEPNRKLMIATVETLIRRGYFA